MNDEAQKTFVVMEMIAEGQQARVLDGLEGIRRNYGKLEIIINEMTEDGQVPMHLDKVGTHDARTTQSDQDASNDMSYDDVCAIARKGHKAGQGAGKKGPNGAGTWYRGKGADELTSGKRDDGGKKGGKKGFKGSKSDWYGDKDKGSNGTKGKGKGKGKSETRYCYDCGEQGHIGLKYPCKLTNRIDEKDDLDSSWESEPEKPLELASLEALEDEGE